MLGTVTSYEHLACDAANTDLGAAAAYELWDVLSPVKSCADSRQDLARYEMSLFRFPLAQRQLLAAMEYLKSVEAEGHEGYFASAASFGFADAVACFEALGRKDVVANLMAAHLAYSQPSALVVGGDSITKSELGGFDSALAAVNPIVDLYRFVRLNQLEFVSW